MNIKYITLIILLLTSCSTVINNENDKIEKTKSKEIREISFDEVQKFKIDGYKIVEGGRLYNDFDLDGNKDTLLILEDINSGEWIGGFEMVKNIKILLLKYDFDLDKWIQNSSIEISGTLFKGIEKKEINNIVYGFILSNSYGVSDGGRHLDIITFGNLKMNILDSFNSSITNGGDLRIEDNGKTILEIDKIHGEGESRDGCHKFIVKKYILNEMVKAISYEQVETKITDNKYAISHKEKNKFELEDFHKDGCFFVGGNNFNAGNYKIQKILKDVGL